MAKDIDLKVDYIQDKVDEVFSTVHKIDIEVALQKASHADHLAQYERMHQEFVRMNDILQGQHESLQKHMHRSDMLEDLVIKIDARFTPIETKHIKDGVIAEYRLERKMKIRNWLLFVAKVAAGAAALITIAVTIKTLSGR